MEISSRENTRILTELISMRVERARPLNLRKNEGVLVVYSHEGGRENEIRERAIMECGDSDRVKGGRKIFLRLSPRPPY